VALHGRDGDADMAFDLGLGDEVERTRLAVMSVDGGNGYWHARDDGTDSGAMVREDLLPLALRLAGLPGDAPVVLFGWSMGGYGALRIACDLGPERVRGVVAVSAALWRRAGETPQGAYDDREDFERNSIFVCTQQLRGIPVRLDCGTSDPFVAANRALATQLPDVTESFTEGGHDDDYWRAQAPAEMAWAAGRFA
jgi:enterochelin esterase-like enzyme